MTNLSDELISSIAEDLQMGLKVYLNYKTGELISLLDNEEYDQNNSLEENEIDPWIDERLKINQYPGLYLQFERMDTDKSFALMEKFVPYVEDEKLKKNLELGLSLSRPFKNFKDIITGSAYEKDWLSFKNLKYKEFVKEQFKKSKLKADTVSK